MTTLQRALLVFAQWATRGCVTVDGVVITVDKTAFTCTVAVGEVKYYNVPLKVLVGTQSSMIEIPKINTQCLLNFRDKSIGRPQIVSIHEAEKVLITVGKSTLEVVDGTWNFNGGNMGGMVKLKELQDSIDSIKNYISALNLAIQNAFIAVGVSTAASGPSGAASYQGEMASQTITIKDFENKKIVQ